MGEDTRVGGLIWFEWVMVLICRYGQIWLWVIVLRFLANMGLGVKGRWNRELVLHGLDLVFGDGKADWYGEGEELKMVCWIAGLAVRELIGFGELRTGVIDGGFCGHGLQVREVHGGAGIDDGLSAQRCGAANGEAQLERRCRERTAWPL
ncbi:hypothetical protein M0R45_009006 [Rubus argutus]|uniref:Uncharacterized protein n=1 Tax=Rubus argutus TaxID=59490 RepID=A0AAW1Y2B9_RUBAR